MPGTATSAGRSIAGVSATARGAFAESVATAGARTAAIEGAAQVALLDFFDSSGHVLFEF